jgi:Polyketide cyclase / dehydrase and lipid transport
MYKNYEILSRIWVQAPSDAVFECLANHHHFTALLGGSCKVIVMAGEGGHALASVRRVSMGFSSFDETIVHYSRGRRLDYRITRYGWLPMRSHYGRIDLTEENGGTRIEYRIQFSDVSVIPLGWLLQKAIKNALNQHALKTLQQQLGGGANGCSSYNG